VITTPEGEVVEEFHERLGRATSNVAEYEAVRIGIARAIALGARRVRVRLDSELVANQLLGRYKVRDPKLLDAYLRVESLLSQLDAVSFEAIPRRENARADKLAQMGARRTAGEAATRRRLAGRHIREGAGRRPGGRGRGSAAPRKVRAPEGRVLGNAQWERSQGKCHRKGTA